MSANRNPIHYVPDAWVETRQGETFTRYPGWYFYEETWSDVYGPFETFGKAQWDLFWYLRHLDHGPRWWKVKGFWNTLAYVLNLSRPTVTT